jgi:hypothetical protein
MFPLLASMFFARNPKPRTDGGPNGHERCYWLGQRGAPTFDKRPWQEVVAEMPADYWPASWPKKNTDRRPPGPPA